MQLDYGGPEALSPKQREQLEAQRDRAIREALTPERYQRYLATKDPIYRQAQSLAANYGLNGKAIQALYELQKSFAARQLQISQNNALTPEQRAQAMQALSLEHQQAIERMRTDTTYTQ
jgi:Spy/CpxP family protein refolding chaperone